LVIWGAGGLGEVLADDGRTVVSIVMVAILVVVRTYMRALDSSSFGGRVIAVHPLRRPVDGDLSF
jgi:hypothetical protein